MAVGTPGPLLGPPAPACRTQTTLAMAQSLDPEEFLVDEEDDIFGEGK